ncbi:MAG: beta-ketoacyl-[acyl-carrier-protein] synthase family protein [Hylemonella sp.]|nr:beta-ketoacyl-[acyl-carrier-protein] synthase family protein [Hylemonella sp.]
MMSLLLSSYTASSCLGLGLDATWQALQSQRSGLKPCDFETVALDTWIGEVPGVDAVQLPAALQDWDCRNNRLALLGLQQDGFELAVQEAVRACGARRVGVFLGTSTSGMLQTELAYRERHASRGPLPDWFHYRETQNTYSVAAFVRSHIGIEGPAFVVSTACSSSAKVFASAQRMMDMGLIDAAVVGGVDSLCLTTLYGFHSLQLLSPQPCAPYGAGRNGISIGEAAAFALLVRTPEQPPAGSVVLKGVGESSDAHHMSAPHPQGLGAQLAMRSALDRAGLRADQIDYINLHGTATPSNDAAEDQAVCAVFGQHTPPCSSTKGHTGHTLGAAGGLEAVVCALALRHQTVPGGCHTAALDPMLHANYQRSNAPLAMQNVLSNSFGFGGSNSCLILGLAP